MLVFHCLCLTIVSHTLQLEFLSSLFCYVLPSVWALAVCKPTTELPRKGPLPGERLDEGCHVIGVIPVWLVIVKLFRKSVQSVHVERKEAKNKKRCYLKSASKEERLWILHQAVMMTFFILESHLRQRSTGGTLIQSCYYVKPLYFGAYEKIICFFSLSFGNHFHMTDRTAVCC